MKPDELKKCLENCAGGDCDDCIYNGDTACTEAKSEAIKEFAERLKPKLYCGHIAMDDCINANINDLVKEMESEDK